MLLEQRRRPDANMFEFLNKKRASPQLLKVATARADLLRFEKLDSFVRSTGIPRSTIDNCIERRADAQMVVVAHDTTLLNFCFIDAAIAFGQISCLESMSGDYDIQELGFSNAVRRACLHKLWNLHSPIAQSNLDFRYRLLLKPHLLDDNETELFKVFYDHIVRQLQLYFSFNQPPNTEWLSLVAELGRTDVADAISRIESWRAAA